MLMVRQHPALKILQVLDYSAPPPPQAKSSPGAGQYDHYGAIGKHASSKQPNAASGVLGCATRDQMSKASCCASDDCCLGLHSMANPRRVTATCGRQEDRPSARQLDTVQLALYTVPDALAPSLCYNPFPACVQLYLSPEHDKQGAGASTPGPNTAEQYSSLGRQRRSLHSTAARWSFSQTPVSATHLRLFLLLPTNHLVATHRSWHASKMSCAVQRLPSRDFNNPGPGSYCV